MSKRRGKYLTALDKPAPSWDSHNLFDRTAACVSWLVIHDFMTDSESTKIRERIKEWVDDLHEAESVMKVIIDTVNDGMKLVDCAVCGVLGVWFKASVAKEVKRDHVCGTPLPDHLASIKWSAKDKFNAV